MNDKRLIVDRSTTGGSGYDGYAWSFRTEVPATTSNEQLKDMKVVFGMMRSALLVPMQVSPTLQLTL